ncbi:hypothetical protein GOV14_04630 [Candidatus Pacearchaeota archaeon]|nr:hypothetical protein [Candidatus Pacearchaeota archaeon]
MKAVIPSHREKKRYLLINSKGLDKKIIDETILDSLGILGYAKACPKIIKKSKDSIILSINRKSLNDIQASFVLSSKDISITKVSGNINNLKP